MASYTGTCPGGHPRADTFYSHCLQDWAHAQCSPFSMLALLALGGAHLMDMMPTLKSASPSES